MKILILALFIFSSLFSNEMQRIENIVSDISKLRVDYEECKQQLSLKNESVATFKASECDCSEVHKNLEIKLIDEKQKNKIILQELDDVKLLESENIKLLARVQELEETVSSQYSVLKEKDNLINSLEIQTIDLKKRVVKSKEEYNHSLKENNVKSDSQKIACETPKDTNIFPKLVMKTELQDTNLEEEIPQEVEAATFRLKEDAKLYDAINGNELFIWEKSTSFTSNVQSQNWVKITGYFIDQKWLPSSDEIWIQKTMVIQR